MVYIGFLLKISPNYRFHTFFGDLTPFFHTFFKFSFRHIIRLLNCYKNIYGLHRFSIGNSSKLAISHLFWPSNTFFCTFFKNFFRHIIRLLNCYKNIYGLRRFPIENSSKLTISHLFWRSNTFFSHLFRNFFSLCTTPHSYQSIKKKSRSISITLL